MTSTLSRVRPVVGVAATLREVEVLHDEWAELAEACEAVPFARPTYALAWWRHLGRGRLLVAHVRVGGRLVALAPLHERSRAGLSVVRWLGHGLGSVAELLVRPGYEATAPLLWQALDRPGRVLHLLETRGGSVAAAPGAAAAHDRCPVIDPVRPADEHLAGPGRRRIRRTLRVAERRLAADAVGFEVTVATRAADWPALEPEVRSVVGAAERARPRWDPWADRYGPFTTEVVREGLARAELVVLLGRVDARPVCFDLLLLGERTASSWIGRFDPAAAPYAPGHLLQRAGLDWAAAHGYHRLDLLLGDAPYKRLWATGSYPTYDVRAGGPAARAAYAGLERFRARGRR